jgi:hypothetical protein
MMSRQSGTILPADGRVPSFDAYVERGKAEA